MTAVRVCAVSEIDLTSAVRVVIDDQPIALVKDSEGNVFAIGDTCTHGDISLSEGFVDDETIECWAHGSQFSLRTGQALTLPAYEPVPVFTVTIEDDDVYIDPTPRYDYKREEA
jgi:3-phenylpropionate/trans-cinnamate dioxygenase ferredoxin subunit